MREFILEKSALYFALRKAGNDSKTETFSLPRSLPLFIACEKFLAFRISYDSIVDSDSRERMFIGLIKVAALVRKFVVTLILLVYYSKNLIGISFVD